MRRFCWTYATTLCVFVKGLKSRLRASKEQRRAEQVERKNVQEAATVMALNLATSIIERAGLGRDIPIPDAP